MHDQFVTCLNLCLEVYDDNLLPHSLDVPKVSQINLVYYFDNVAFSTDKPT